MRDYHIDQPAQLIKQIKDALPNAYWGDIKTLEITWKYIVLNGVEEAYPDLKIIFETNS